MESLKLKPLIKDKDTKSIGFLYNGQRRNIDIESEVVLLPLKI